MTESTHSRPLRPAGLRVTGRLVRGRLVMVGLALGLAGATAIAIALASQQPGPPAAMAPSGVTSSALVSTMPGQATSSERSPSPSTPTKIAPPKLTLTESTPTRLDIPSIGVRSALVDLGLDGGAMETPSDPDLAGWFTGAHTPGGPGTSVVVGHVTWNRRPTVFYELGHVKVGSRVQVARTDGTTVTFTVRKVGTFAKSAFPDSEVYSPDPAPRLILITCGGAYDRATSHYDSNVIVWADLTSTR